LWKASTPSGWRSLPSGRYLVGIRRQRLIIRFGRTSATEFISRSTMVEDIGFQCVVGVISVNMISMKVWAVVVVASLGFVGVSLANPLDSPGTVYIDGVPCNLPCQSYMAWSRKAVEANQGSAKGAASTSVAKAMGEAPRKRISKRAQPASTDVASQKKKAGDFQAALTAPSEPPPLPRPRVETAPLNVETREPTAPLTAAPEQAPAPKLTTTENAHLLVETSHPPAERSPRELVVAALAIAEQITNAETPKAPGKDRTDETRAGDANVSTPLVALLLSRPDVKSATTLNGLNVAIDRAQSAVEEDIRIALAAAGAADARLSIGDASPLDRLVSGDVQAAVVKLVSPDAAEAFPDIKGFKVLRVPLSSH
jgi:hypothetical protein